MKTNNLNFTSIIEEDLEELKKFQPEGWTDIIPDISFYVESDFCNPIKTNLNGDIIGIGASISHNGSSWLAHIIVDPDHRNKGLGLKIVNKLIDDINIEHFKSILLIATQLGIPVYEKAGFRKVTDYVTFKRQNLWGGFPLSENIISYDEKYRDAVLDLDKRVSGEDRKKYLLPYIQTSKLFVKNDNLLGLYMPDLGEGMILGETDEAGIELMKLKYANSDKAVLPENNNAGMKFLQENGFVETLRLPRMVLGQDLNWQPEKIFSRIGGKVG